MEVINKYYIEETYGNNQFTAGIVRKDNEAILYSEGFKPIRFAHIKEGSITVKLLRLINAFSTSFKIQQKSIILFHFPLLAKAYSLLHTCLKWRGIKTVALIIDIDGLRDKDEIKLKQELKQLAKFDYIVAHNDAMRNFILQHLQSATVFTVDIFDYPVNGTAPSKFFSRTIAIAANHSKGTYVYNLNELAPLQFNLYGTGYNEELQTQASNIFYKGIIPPAGLPQQIEGSFGLVWDGPSLTTCDEYLKYNNPHKLSLYIAAGMPVIVWEQSATAAFVKQNNIGITVQSLTELNAVINSLNEDDYEKMKQNVNQLKAKVKNGYYLKTAISKITSAITGA